MCYSIRRILGLFVLLVNFVSISVVLVFAFGQGLNPFTGIGVYSNDCTIQFILEKYTDSVKVQYTIDDYSIHDYDSLLPISELPSSLPTTVRCWIKDGTMYLKNPNQNHKVLLWISLWSASIVISCIALCILNKFDNTFEKVDYRVETYELNEKGAYETDDTK